MKMTNCKNCGAPITNGKCEYCGTIYYDFTNLNLHGKNIFRFMEGGKIVEAEVYPIVTSIEASTFEKPRLCMEFIVDKFKVESEVETE